jgi:amino acid transporter
MSDMEQTPAASAGAGANTGPIGETRSIGLSILWFIITLGIYGIYWIYKTMEEMKRHTGQGIGGVLGLVIWLVIGIVMWFVTPSEVGQMYKRDGREPPVSGVTGLWWLLPLVGAIVWFVKTQGALNRYWESKGASAA